MYNAKLLQIVLLRSKSFVKINIQFANFRKTGHSSLSVSCAQADTEVQTDASTNMHAQTLSHAYPRCINYICNHTLELE